MAEDYGVSLKITADTSDLDKVQQKVDETQKKIERPVEQTVEAKVEQPAPVKVPVEQPAPVKVPVEQPAPVKVPVEQPAPVKVPVEQPAPVKVEAKAEKVRVEVDGEAAKKTIADLKADARFKVTADTREAVGSFNALRAAMDVLHGNFAGLAMEMAKLSNGAGMLKTIGVSGFLAIGGAIMGVVSLARSLRDLFSTMFNTNTVGRDISSLGSRLVDIRNEAENFATAMDDARKAADLVNQSLEKEISALGRVAKAQSEINRQRELAGAASDDERAAINTRYDRQALDIDATTAQQSDEVRRKSIEDEIERLKKEIQQSDVTIAAYNQTAKAARQRAELNQPYDDSFGGGVLSAADSIATGILHQKSYRDKAEAASTVATNAQNAADDEIERKAALEEALEKKLHELKMADLDAEARKAEQKAKEEKVKAEAAARAKQREDRQAKEQGEFERERGKSAADAEFEDRMRAEQRKASAPGATEADRSAAENAQIAMLREREDAAKKKLSDAKAALDAELKKPSAERDEKAMSRAREDIRANDTTATDARRRREDLEASAETRREDLEASAETRRANVAQDYFGNLAQQIEQSRPRGRLQQMGLMGTDRATADIQRKISGDLQRAIELIREQVSLARAQSYKNTISTYAP